MKTYWKVNVYHKVLESTTEVVVSADEHHQKNAEHDALIEMLEFCDIEDLVVQSSEFIGEIKWESQIDQEQSQ